MNYFEQDQEYIINTYARNKVVLAEGSGATVLDIDGKSYIDLGSGIGVNSLGYCDAEWAQAVANQASRLSHTSNLYYTTPVADVAKKLSEMTGYNQTFFCNSGAEANECAIKIARKYSYDKYGQGRDIVVSLVNSFHGRTMATLTATGQEVFHNYFFPFLGGHEYIEATVEGLTKINLAKSCAVIIELVQGEGGVTALDKEFVTACDKLCKDNDIALIIDEVQTGVSRTGKLLASQWYGILPNITTLAKGLGGGLPIGACMADEKYAKVLTFGNHGTTFGGNPIVCAGAKVVLDRVSQPQFNIEVCDKAQYIRTKLQEIDEIDSVSGLGLMIGVSLKTKKATDVVQQCLQQGVLLLTAKTKLRLLPPLNISYNEIDRALAVVKKVLEE